MVETPQVKTDLSTMEEALQAAIEPLKGWEHSLRDVLHLDPVTLSHLWLTRGTKEIESPVGRSYQVKVPGSGQIHLYRLPILKFTRDGNPYPHSPESLILKHNPFQYAEVLWTSTIGSEIHYESYKNTVDQIALTWRSGSGCFLPYSEITLPITEKDKTSRIEEVIKATFYMHHGRLIDWTGQLKYVSQFFTVHPARSLLPLNYERGELQDAEYQGRRYGQAFRGQENTPSFLPRKINPIPLMEDFFKDKRGNLPLLP